MTFTRGTPFLIQPAPACENPTGVVWSQINTDGNTLACISTGFQMQEGAALAPETDAEAIPGYDPNNVNAFVHIHFEGSSSTTWAGLRLQTSHNAQCSAPKLEVRADGAWRVMESLLFTGQTTCSDQVTIQGKMAPGSDWDLDVQLAGSVGSYTVNGRAVLGGGMLAFPGAPLGVLVEDSTGVSIPAYFSQFEMDHPVDNTMQYVLAV